MILTPRRKMEGQQQQQSVVPALCAFVIDERGAPTQSTALESIKRAAPEAEIHIVRDASGGGAKHPAGTHIHIEELDSSVVDASPAQALIWVPANLDVSLLPASAWEQLDTDLHTKSPHRNRFAIASTLRYLSGPLVLGHLLSVLWLGFLPVLAVLDAWRGLANGWGYHVPGDLRVETLTTTYPSRKHVAASGQWCCFCWPLSLLWSRFAMRRSAPTRASLVQLLRAGDEFGHLCHTVRTHPHLTWLNWLWLPAFTCYYWFFALPWWNWIVPRLATNFIPALLSNRDVLRIPFEVLYYWPLSFPWLVVLTAHVLFFVLPITMRRMQLGLWPTLLSLVLYPVYLTLSPLLWFLIKVSG